MKAVFIHDIKSMICDGNVFARSYGANIWKRYLSIFEDIIVCTRSRIVSKDSTIGVDLLSIPHVHFDDRIGMFYGPDALINRRIYNILYERINVVDFAIIRLDSFLGLVACGICKKINKPYIIEVVGCAWDSFWNHGIYGKLLAPYIFFRMRKAVKEAKFVVYVTKYFLQKRYPTNGMSINISNVDLPVVADSILDESIRKIKNIYLSESPFINLMTAANVGVRYKGMHFVIKALGRLKRRGNCNYIYHIIGEGDRSFLEEIAAKEDVEDNIVFHGPLSHSEVIAFMKNQVDIYIQPSLQEGLPRSVIEAMSVGLPCIGSDVAGIPELLDPKCMFKRKANIPIQIEEILMSFNEEVLIEQAKANFSKAKDYQANILNKRRIEFFNSALKS